ncbi:MAG: alpha/beta hydrolase-fold protein [Bacteroidota bacterium]
MKKIALLALILSLSAATQAQKVNLASGKLVRIENFRSQYVEARVVDVWLPDGYTPSKKYAVLYMHDGQMLFDTALTWNHQEWGIDETVSALIKKRKIRPCIVVGVWNGGKLRHCEYFPEKAFESMSKEQQQSIYSVVRTDNQAVFASKVISDLYLKFLVKEVKPYIDSAFSTLPDRSNTFIAGSSMGGLISMYAICEYPAVFGGAACLSTHWTGIYTVQNNPLPDALLDYLEAHLPDPAFHKIYFDYGDKTLDSLYKPFQSDADAIMKTKGYSSSNWMTRYFPGEDHSEKAWAKRLNIPLEFLMKPSSK